MDFEGGWWCRWWVKKTLSLFFMYWWRRLAILVNPRGAQPFENRVYAHKVNIKFWSILLGFDEFGKYYHTFIWHFVLNQANRKVTHFTRTYRRNRV